jgi:hypothetical protein
MASAATYSRTGRIAMWGLATTYTYYELTDGDDDYINDVLSLGAWAGATGALWIPEIVPWVIGRGVHYGAAAGMSGLRIAAPYVSAAATAAASVAAGAAIGATAGTAISAAIWGEEGARTALGFYSGGTLPGTEEPNLSDFQYIIKPTAPGGPVSLYDVAEIGLKGTLRGIGWLHSKAPAMPSRAQWNPYMI